jgi:hypothetical protein
VRRLGALVLVAASAGAVWVSAAGAALFLLFDPVSAEPGDAVTVRLGGTPAGYTRAQRETPTQRPIRVYLVRNEDADGVKSRFDPRLHFVGAIVPDRRHRGVLTFRAPPLDSGTYVAAAWCPGCARYSFGRTFFASGLPETSRYRGRLAVRLELPAATGTSCPVSSGRVGNGILSTGVPGSAGVLATRRDVDGTLFQKLWWLPKRGFHGRLAVRGERLDAPGEMTVLSVNWGYSSDGRGSWASAVAFPSEGCWRLSGRVGDVKLTYVVKVVAGCGDTYTPPPCGRTARSSS